MKKIILIISSLFLLVVSSTTHATEISEQNSFEARYAYAMGYRMGQSLKSRGVKKLSPSDVLKGINDFLDDKSPERNEVELDNTITSYHQSLKIKSNSDSIANQEGEARYSYALGYRVGQALKTRGVKKPKPGDLLSGINDCLDDKNSRLTEAELIDAITSYNEYLNALSKKGGIYNVEENL